MRQGEIECGVERHQPTLERDTEAVSLRSVLLRLMLLAALPIVAVSLGLIAHLLTVQQQALRASMLDSSRTLALAVDRELSTWQAIAETLARASSLANDDIPGFQRLAHRVSLVNPGSRIVLVSPDGFQLMNTASDARTLPRLFMPDPAQESVDMDDRARANTALWRRVLATGQPQFSDLFIGRADPKPSLSYRTPVYRGSKIAYILAIAFPPDGLNALLSTQTLSSVGDNWIAAIVDRRGEIAARSQQATAYTGHPASTDLLRSIRRHPEGLDTGKTLEGTRALYAYSQSSRAGWTVAIAVPSNAAQAGLWRSVFIWSALVLALIALGVIVARRTWRDLGEPLRVLADNARLFEDGAAIIQPQSRIREIRDCGHAWSVAIRADQARRAQERLRLEAEAREREMAVAGREKDRVLAALGHELRNPLGAISNSVHVLEATGPRQDQRAIAMIAIIKRQTEHLSRLVDNLLDLARAAFGKMPLARAPLDLFQLARSTVAGYTPRLGVAPSITIRGEPVWVEGDPTRLGQVLRNLIDNAMKFTPSSGAIDVHVSAEDEDAMLIVSDDGAGIPPELAESLFGAFVQSEQPSDRQYGGLGLGLALVRQIVQMHDGVVRIESEGLGKGTRVIVRIPRCAPEPKMLHHADQNLGATRRRVLVVEDQADARASLVSLLRLMGHVVLDVADANEAVEIVDRWNPDVMLIDIGLPGIDGNALARAVRARPTLAAVRLVALTGYAQEMDRARARDAGFDAFIAKPADRDLLEMAIGDANGDGGRR